MSKPLPLLYGMYYHIYHRGNNRENVFVEERNYAHLLKLYAKYVEPVADTYAYCLLRNHFHFLVRIKTIEELDPKGLQDPSGLKAPSQQFGKLFDAYAKAINKAYHRTGSLFQHPFRRIQVTSDEYFARLIQYIHFNPQKHGFVNDFREYPYSSYRILCSDKATRLRRDEVLAWCGGRESFETMHQQTVDEKRIAKFIEDDYD